MGEAVAGAFGVGFDSVDALDADEPTQQMAVGEKFAELAVGEFFDDARDVASQCHAAAEAKTLGLCGGHFFQVRQLLLGGELDELMLELGEAEDFIDSDEEFALVAVVFAGFDFNERWTKGLLIDNLRHGWCFKFVVVNQL